MSFLSLVKVEHQKVRRSKIFLILILAAVILWIPSVLNADLNFGMQAVGISPENSFFIQGFMAMAWFLFPAAMVVITVLQTQTERNDHGILKMLSLPVGTAKLCMAKFAVLVSFSAVQILMSVGMYYISAAAASHTQGYAFCLPPLFVFKEACMMWASAIPMLAFFWLLAVCIRTPVFSIGIGLASIVPSVLMINTKVWFAYPMAYPFFVTASEYGKLAANLETAPVRLIPWLPAAALITAVCLIISCLCFGQAERR